MNPNTAFSASLVTSLVLWYPSMRACLRGDLDLTPAALRYLAALTVSRLAMNFLARLLNAYRAQPAQELRGGETPPAADDGGAGSHNPSGPLQRRRHDRQSEGDGVDPTSLAA
ncbi:MAG TPA: hypothetical protein VEG38_04380 [Acidimicrobiia bacterium]|nr:hypothetical protein [Acidimicrobiia bacterium]